MSFADIGHLNLFRIVLLEVVEELPIQFAIKPVRFRVDLRVSIGLDLSFYGDHGGAAIFDRWKYATGNAGEDGVSKQAGLLVDQSHNRPVADVRLDLVPKIAARPAPSGPDLADGDAGALNGIQVAAQEKCHALQQGPHKVPACVAEGETGEGAARERIGLRAERAHQMRQHDQAV